MEIFIGRFHPLIVHLPIGFIMLAFVFETLAFLVKPMNFLKKAVPYMYLAGFIVGVAAVSSGWMLSENGAYPEGALRTHKWMAILSMVLALVLGILRLKKNHLNKKLGVTLSVALVLIISVAGHFGGVLTHGDDYLYEYAPRWFQRMAGFNPNDELDNLAETPPDSVMLYANVVKPILQAKCVRCHSDKEPSGGFNAAQFATLFEEGETGTAVISGSLSESELIRRVTLPTSSIKFMPPNGEPLSYTELKVLQYWIDQGADSLARFDYASMDTELARLVKRDYALDFTPKPYYEKVQADSLAPEAFEELLAAGFSAKYLGGDNFFLDVSYEQDTLPATGLTALAPVKDNVTFLDLSDLVLLDSLLPGLTDFPNLTRLDLHGSNVTDGAFEGFSEIEHLEVLNVYKTPVSDRGIENALASPSLRRVYIWQTSVSDDEADKLVSDYPAVQFDRGFTFIKPDTTASSSTP
jgi:uncharacterized membrane protein